MFSRSRRHLSYMAQKRERNKLFRGLLVVLALFLLYNLIATFLFSVWVLHNNTMQPSLRAGDRFFVVSSALPNAFATIRQSDRAIPFKRGSVVLIDSGHRGNHEWLSILADSVVRFFTAQRISLFAQEEHLHLKRLVGLPGDEISMSNFVLRIRPAGSAYSLTEFELSERPYQPNIPQIPALWDESLPFSGSMDTKVLGPNEYFVIADDRSNTGDSRTWGPIGAREIIGRPVLRFWPLPRIGLL